MDEVTFYLRRGNNQFAQRYNNAKAALARARLVAPRLNQQTATNGQFNRQSRQIGKVNA
jgi:hypothetical protein